MPTTRKPPPRTALLVGATGLVGREFLAQLLAHPAYGRVHVWLRRPVAGLESTRKLAVEQVDFTHPPAAPTNLHDVYIALGTTIKVAGSREAFRQVDHDFVLNVARAARAAGAQRLAVVSGLGADRNSRIFYNQVKGEMQASVAALGFGSVVFAQPSLLLGDRAALGQPVRGGEVWAARLLGPLMGLVPRRVRPIEARAVAGAMIDAVLDARPDVRMLASSEMQPAPGR